MSTGKLILNDGTSFSGTLFGDTSKISDGEVVFATAMTGYEQTLTDPSYCGQIITFTYPLVGNYGVPPANLDQHNLATNWESQQIWAKGVVLANNPDDYSHYAANQSLSEWLQEQNIGGIYGIDTRALTQHLRENGSQLGQIVADNQTPLTEINDPNQRNLVDEVSVKEITVLKPEKPNNLTVAVIDTGIKNNILQRLLAYGLTVIRCPWDTDLSQLEAEFDGLFIANGPGNPEMVAPIIKKAIDYCRQNKKPIWGICLGNQILSLALGAKTRKMRYGHRGVNQPC